ncbi:acetate/propionate family kinase [Aureimonas sp. AU4]|uniref:acetate/propionate family kinase n=1 Tax=Aureimonas sp. AU4 TaxID=1638163 RepID=UPI0007827C78|nr:acetate/propionate family kinase [Aureimonas sp. AU4]
MAETPAILALNAGSSSVKFALFEAGAKRTVSGALADTGSGLRLEATAGGTRTCEDWTAPGGEEGEAPVRRLVAWLEAHLPAGRLDAVGHRVAIGGLAHSAPVRVTPDVLAALRALTPLAPLHQPRSLAPIEALAASHPALPQVACFDTSFHRTMPREAETYALPRALTQAGARRYGFHGLSYEYIAGQLTAIDARAAGGRTIICHLGSGASLCAMRAGRSIATTMGFSPLSGLVMATRPGDLDPGLVIWLLRERGLSLAEVEHLLYHDCGLKGVSGSSGDMRVLLASDDARAREAVALFVQTVAGEIGRLGAALGGLDALVFTAGIGEHAPAIREAVCRRSEWLGVRLDEERNRAGQGRISRSASPVSVFVVPTDEERVVAHHTARLLMADAAA